MAIYEIPLIPAQQTLQITLPGGVFRLRLIYCDAPDAGWIMDISDANDNPLICGVPLVTGSDLLAQYPDLAIGAYMYVTTDADQQAVPTFENLGIKSHLWVEF